MTFVTPKFSRSHVRRAGIHLTDPDADIDDFYDGYEIMVNWRASHGYPLNTFQATLRNKLKQIGDPEAVVGQRLKRAQSIIVKLLRFSSMGLNQMQDIAGLRAVVSTMPKLRKLHENYRNSIFTHELVKTNDYVLEPKADGYRSIHLVYRYVNPRAPAYDGLHVELQMRTKLQHAWATAVETVDAFLEQAIKAGRPTAEWADFFCLVSAAFSIEERTPVLEALKGVPHDQILDRLRTAENRLGVLIRLAGFRVAADKISRSGRSTSGYHLVILNTAQRTLEIESFSLAEQDQANIAYAKYEQRALSGEPIDAVLVTGGTVESLRKSYPNYFLDTGVFVARLNAILLKGFRALAVKKGDGGN